MDIQQLKYFKEVAVVGKISEAAEALFISAPALSTSVSRLEKELGVSLFDRAGNRITLNEQGRIFLQHTNEILHNLEIAKEELKKSLQAQADTVNIASLNSFLWINLISAFASEFPSCAMSYSNTSARKLDDHGFPTHLSFLLSYENEVPPHFNVELESVVLFQSKPVVMLNKDHPLANATEIDIRMLKGEKILLSYTGFSLGDRIRQLFELAGMPYPTENHYSHLARQKMVSDNVGVSFASHAADVSFSPNIRYVPLADPFEPWTAKMYWRSDRPLTEHEELFRTFTENYYRDLH